ncbi:MAG: hypothetical protein PHS45_02670 [Bacilli bacterium]|nr:hypothetical protein [Bacilli bacterium]
MEKKNYIYLSLIVLIVIIVSAVVYIMLKSEAATTYEGTAKVVERKNFKQVTVKLDIDDKNNVAHELDIYSNIFGSNDRVKIEYVKKGKEYNVTKIEAIVDTQIEKSRLVSNIENDLTMRKYREMMEGYADISETGWSETDDKMPITHFEVLPEKLSNQHYKTLDPSEFFEIKYYLTDTELNTIQKDLNIKITITGEEDFTILSLKNIHNNNEKEILYEVDENSFTLTSLGYGIYVAQIEFENGDIINYIFV